MTEFSSSREDLINCLKHYTSLLQKRKDALGHLSQASAEVRAAIDASDQEKVDKLIDLRQRECERFVEIDQSMNVDEELLLKLARCAATDSSDDLRRLGKSALILRADSEALGNSILDCQRECENILKARLEETSEALRKSVQQRKLDVAYGPAHRQDATPAFLDKQR